MNSQGTVLLRKVQAHLATLPEHVKARRTAMLLDALYTECSRLQALCVHVHDRLLRGDSDAYLLDKLESAWKPTLTNKVEGGSK